MDGTGDMVSNPPKKIRKKRDKPKPATYSKQDMYAAVHAVNNKILNQTEAAKHFGVPRQTLNDKIQGKEKSSNIS